MSENPHQPREYDAVLGGQTPPSSRAVLGGIEGVKRRLANADFKQKSAALEEALKYGEAGLDLVIQTLQYESGALKWVAYLLLRHRQEAKVKQAVKEHAPRRGYTMEMDSAIKSIAISPDGKLLVSGFHLGPISVWDLQAKQIQPISMDHSNVDFLGISHDSKTLVSRGGNFGIDHKVKVWDLQTGQYRRDLKGRNRQVISLAISPDGKNLVCSDITNHINLWNLQTGEFTHTIGSHSRLIQALAVSSDSKILVSGSDDKTIKAWDFKTGELIHTFEKHSDDIETIAISPNGQTIVSGSKDKTVKVWNLQTKKLQFTLARHEGWISCIAISPDGNTVASSGSDSNIIVWNLQTGEYKCTFKSHTDWVNCLAISPDGETLVSGSRDKTIKVW